MPRPSHTWPALLLASTLLPATALGAADGEPNAAEAGADSQASSVAGLGVGQVSRLHLLADRFSAVETTTGELLFISGNGRYVIRGQAADLWHGQILKTYDELVALAGRLDLARIGIDTAELGALRLGTPEAPATTIFLDPRCPHCEALLTRLDPDLLARHRFDLVLLPVLGQASEQDTVRLLCLAETAPEAAAAILLHGDIEALPLPEAGSTCGQGAAQRALIAAQLLGITGTPFVIAADGRTHRGAPPAFPDWLTLSAAAQ